MSRHPFCGRVSRVVAALLTAAGVAAGTSLAAPSATMAAAEKPRAVPAVSPVPQQMQRIGADVVVPRRVQVVVGSDTDAPARRLLVQTLREHGADRVDVVTSTSSTAPLSVHLGSVERGDVAAALGGSTVPDHPEGYALRVDRSASAPLGSVALGGVDADGQYYAVQTLRQLFVPNGHARSRIAGVEVSDFPAMPLRGTIEGFYGNPWTHQERLAQLSFYGDVKANTYIYAPKDDPFHRARWREPYPADKLAELTELVDQAAAHHVRFTFALSPGETICYSSAADFRALLAKLQEMYDAGVRAFSIPLDDIQYSEWNCAADEQRFGRPSAAAAGAAQVYLLNRVQREFIETHQGAKPLQMVPTEYYNTVDSPYKAMLREDLDTDVVVMWTGEGVVPASVTVEQARAAAKVFGGPTFLWDNYPVNDYDNTAGRLLLAPYAKREAGLSDHLAGIVSNPMNQAAASKVAVFGFADFTWNDRAYAPMRNWRAAMGYLASGDRRATNALLVFGDLNHMAPTFDTQPWQPQAPRLAARIERFQHTWDSGERLRAIHAIRAYAERIAAAPGTIRAGTVEPAFVSDARPWLDATALWGQSFLQSLDALRAQLAGDAARAVALRQSAEALATEATQLRVQPPDNRWGAARVKIADGVLDSFLRSTWDMIDQSAGSTAR
jgi:hyaluronoglucosaminidase